MRVRVRWLALAASARRRVTLVTHRHGAARSARKPRRWHKTSARRNARIIALVAAAARRVKRAQRSWRNGAQLLAYHGINSGV